MFSHLPAIGLRDRPDPANVRAIDIGVIPMLIHMNRRGMALDLPYLRELGSQFSARAAEIRKQLISSIPYDKLQEFEYRFGLQSGNATDTSTDFTRKVTDDGDLESTDVEPETEDPEPASTERKYIDSPRETDVNVNGINLGSSQQVALLLFDVLGLDKKVELATTKTGDKISTGKKNLDALKPHSELVSLLLDYKELTKLRTTYCEGLPKQAVFHPRSSSCPVCGWRHYTDIWKLHPTVGTTQAATGRMNCTNPNLQNIPARTKNGQQIRAAFIPEPGYRLLTADYAQIELRWLANESGDPFMRSIYEQGKDIHVATTLEMYGYPPNADTKAIPDFDSLRRGAKTINFGIVYGLSDLGLQSALSLSGVHKRRHECKTMIRKWFDTYKFVEKLIAYYKRICDTYAMTWTAFGRPRLIPEIRSTHYRVRAEGYRKAGNHPIQGSAGDGMKIAARNLHDYFQNQDPDLGVYHNMLIHDESLNEVPEDKDTGKILDLVTFIMESAVEIEVPIVADGKVLKDRWVK